MNTILLEVFLFLALAEINPIAAMLRHTCLGNVSRVKRYKNSHISIITLCIFGISAELEDIEDKFFQ